MVPPIMKNRRGAQAGPTAFAPFPGDYRLFGDIAKPDGQFRVASLDAMMAQLRAAGIAVELDAQIYPMAASPSVRPEGNPIELWEPAGRNAP